MGRGERSTVAKLVQRGAAVDVARVATEASATARRLLANGQYGHWSLLVEAIPALYSVFKGTVQRDLFG